jgi:hypothetical protein
MMNFFLILLFVITTSCAHQKYLDEHQTFLRTIEQNKQSMTKPEYRAYLNYQLNSKENELQGLTGMQQNSEGNLAVQETMTNQYTSLDNYDFQSNSTKINLKRIDEKQKLINKQIFYLRSELSSLSK